MPSPKERRGFFRRLSENLENVDKQTLLSRLMDESERYENWRAIFNRLDEGVLVVSPVGEIDFINSSALQILGISSEENTPFWTKLTDSDLRTFFETYIPNLNSEILQTIRVLNPRERSLKLHIHPDILKNPPRHLVSITDLTEPILPEVERVARNRFESLIRLAGGLAHEIGNPLNAISLHSAILKKEVQNQYIAGKEKMLEIIDVIQDEIHRLDQTVRNFLKTTRRAPLRFQMLNLSSTINDVLRVMRPALEEHHIELAVALPEKVEFFQDEERIRSMLINLVQNSIESMSGGGKLQIQVQLQGQAVQILIQDTGKGIAAEDLPHIFEAYFTTKDHGSGLGLLFVYDTVTDHGGKIQVESKAGQGTRFEILLPLRRSNLQIEHPMNQKDRTENHA